MSNGEKDILHFSFLNFFQRPAIKEDDDFNKLDNSIGNKVIKEVVGILQPEYIFLLSYKAWIGFNIDYDSKILMKLLEKGNIEYSCHPTSPSWNKESKEYSIPRLNKERGTGKEKFKYSLNNIINGINERQNGA
jgi:hypothetical protein